jgi:hypothetical protein
MFWGLPVFMDNFNDKSAAHSFIVHIAIHLTTILPILFLYLNTVTVTAGTFEP